MIKKVTFKNGAPQINKRDARSIRYLVKRGILKLELATQESEERE